MGFAKNFSIAKRLQYPKMLKNPKIDNCLTIFVKNFRSILYWVRIYSFTFLGLIASGTISRLEKCLMHYKMALQQSFSVMTTFEVEKYAFPNFFAMIYLHTQTFSMKIKDDSLSTYRSTIFMSQPQ